jgi:hypothetical protein
VLELEEGADNGWGKGDVKEIEDEAADRETVVACTEGLEGAEKEWDGGEETTVLAFESLTPVKERCVQHQQRVRTGERQEKEKGFTWREFGKRRWPGRDY